MSDPFATIKEALQTTCQDSNKIPGAILAAIDRKGNLILHESAGIRQVGDSSPMDKNALHWMASCTKLITAIACMQLVEQGKVDLDEPIETIVTEYATLEKYTKTKATMRHLLTHTSGQSYSFFNNDTAKFYDEHKLNPFGCKMNSIMAPLNCEPGTKWEYGTNIDWAGQIVERISGSNLDAYFKKNIFEPVGIKNMTLLPQSGVPGGVKKTLAGMNFKQDGKVKAMDHVIEQDESQMELQYGGAGAYGNAAEVRPQTIVMRSPV